LGEEMAHGLSQDGPDGQRRPRRSFRCRTWPRIRANVNWLTSSMRVLRRRYSCTHAWTSASRSWGTYTVRVFPACRTARSWAWCKVPPWWQEEEGWAQRVDTRLRLAASTGPAGTNCWSRLFSIRRIRVGRPGTRMDGPSGLPVNGRYTGKGPKNQGCEEKKGHPGRPSDSTAVLLPTCVAVTVRRKSRFSELPTEMMNHRDSRRKQGNCRNF